MSLEDPDKTKISGFKILLLFKVLKPLIITSFSKYKHC